MKEYRYMPLRSVLRHEPEMRRLKVSEVARSPRGYLTALKRAGSYDKLSDKWKQKRRGFVSRHLAQYKKNPTKRHRLALIAWSYDPES